MLSQCITVLQHKRKQSGIGCQTKGIYRSSLIHLYINKQAQHTTYIYTDIHTRIQTDTYMHTHTHTHTHIHTHKTPRERDNRHKPNKK